MYPELSEAERFPMLSEPGRKLLHSMRQHPHAPQWNWPNGEQLNEAGLSRVQQFALSLQQPAVLPLAEPSWMADYIDRCLKQVPFYRSRSRPGTKLFDLPTCRREDLAPKPWDFVPDDQPLDELIVFSSSGTTGHPTRTPHHPYSAACGVPLLEHALQSLHNIKFQRGPSGVAIANLAAYRGAYTTAIVVSYLHEAGCIRVNLDPSAWRQKEDARHFINHWQAPVWLGDPVAFGALEPFELDHKPQAIISSIMHMHDGYSEHLSARYGCPVLDVYALTEAGIVAVRNQHGHRILPTDLYVEILNENGEPCDSGVRGEVTLTGGRNPFLPLLRYRTGDYASLQWIDGHQTLVDLVGREPVQYKSESGRTIHSMEIVRLMRGYPVRRFELRPITSGYKLTLDADIDHQVIIRELRQLLGNRLIVDEH